MREVDRLARFGGEEFLVRLPRVLLAEAQPVAERLRALVAVRRVSARLCCRGA